MCIHYVLKILSSASKYYAYDWRSKITNGFQLEWPQSCLPEENQISTTRACWWTSSFRHVLLYWFERANAYNTRLFIEAAHDKMFALWRIFLVLSYFKLTTKRLNSWNSQFFVLQKMSPFIKYLARWRSMSLKFLQVSICSKWSLNWVINHVLLLTWTEHELLTIPYG